MSLYTERSVAVWIGARVTYKNRNRNASVNLQNSPHSHFPWVTDHSCSHWASGVAACIICFLAATSITQAREKESVISSFYLLGMLTSLFVKVPLNNKSVNLPVNKSVGWSPYTEHTCPGNLIPCPAAGEEIQPTAAIGAAVFGGWETLR